MKLNLPKAKMPISRRQFLVGAAGSALAAGTREAASHTPVYDENLAPLPSLGKSSGKRILLVFSPQGYRTQMASKDRAFANTTLGVAGAFAANAVDNTITRRGALFAPTTSSLALLGLGALHGRKSAAVRSEGKHLEMLEQELAGAGYQVHRTNNLDEFAQKLNHAAKNRPEDARTIILIDAHGGVSQKGAVIYGSDSNGNRQEMSVALIASIAHRIPGHNLLASSSCQLSNDEILDEKPAGKSKKTGSFTVISLAGGKGQAGNLELPIFSAIRNGIRSPEKVSSATMDAIVKKLTGAPAATKHFAGKAGLPSMLMKGEFQL